MADDEIEEKPPGERAAIAALQGETHPPIPCEGMGSQMAKSDRLLAVATKSENHDTVSVAANAAIPIIATIGTQWQIISSPSEKGLSAAESWQHQV